MYCAVAHTAPENNVPALMLDTYYMLDGSPVCTAAAMVAFLTAWNRNDPHGVWPSVIVANAEHMTLEGSEYGDIVCRAVDIAATGECLYHITGLTQWDAPS